nr:rhodanese-like domain-containing protein [Pseudomonas sp.]
MLAWPMLSRARGSAGGIDTLVATQMVNQKHAVFVDVRPAEEYAKGHIPQARSLPLDQIEARAQSLPKNKPLIIVCATGRSAGTAITQLKAKGLENVVALSGGMTAWHQAGLPVTTR